MKITKEQIEKWYQCYLGPSKIKGAGIGVFARRKIKKGEKIWLGSPDDIKWYKKPVKGRLKELLSFYALETKSGYWGPIDFSRMSLDFFINHSDNSNAERPGDVVFFAKREIRAGEEITTDYEKLDMEINNKRFFKR